MQDLFEEAQEIETANTAAPLATRMRPRSLEEFVGQEHILGPGKLLRRAIEADRLPSVIFYGPPGTGKTTLARVIAELTQARGLAARQERLASLATMAAGAAGMSFPLFLSILIVGRTVRLMVVSWLARVFGQRFRVWLAANRSPAVYVATAGVLIVVFALYIAFLWLRS